MGALTSCKRTGDYCSLNNSPPMVNCHSEHHYHLDSHISKKRRLSPMSSKLSVGNSFRSLASRLSRYPPISQLRRKVHAPCRNAKFEWSSNDNQYSWFDGELTSSTRRDAENRYEEAKSRTLGFFFTRKWKKELDAKPDLIEDVLISDVSDADIIEKIKAGHEGGSVISDQRLQETNGLAFHSKTLDPKSRIEEDGVAHAFNSAVSDMTRAESPVKMLDSLSLDPKTHVDIPVYKTLLQSARRSDSRLHSLLFDISLEELKLKSYVSPVKKQAEEDVHSIHFKESFAPLTEEEHDKVTKALSNASRRNVLVIHEDSNIEITGEKLQCLRPGAWLNDEVINVYFELLKERERRDPKKFLQCHFFNSFFYKRLAGGRNGYDYKSVRRWTSQKKLGYALIECDKIFVPIHKEVHWCLAVINNKDKKFQYLDSLGGKDSQVMRVLARYIKDEVKDKNGQEIDVSSWECEVVDNLPMQENGSDCGVFMIKYADFYSRDLGLRFRQEDMPYFRKRIVKELLQLRAE